MPTWRERTRDGVRLACRDFGGEGPSVLLLHGLAGHAEEWASTAAWLTTRCRVVGLDARGHGRSERSPDDVSRAAQVADAAFAVERLRLQPAVVVGQSLGGLTAISLAARHPDLVRALVVVEASPEGGLEDGERTADEVGEALRAWPVPFASRADAEAFFTDRFGGPLAAAAWTSGLERRDDGWWPRFDVRVMQRTLREALSAPSWDDWERIACPTLIVRAGAGTLTARSARDMVARLPGSRLVEIGGAGHDVHLDRPDEWRETVSAFVDSVDLG